MKRLMILSTLFINLFVYAQKKPDLSATIDQSAFNKIINSADIPLVLFEHRDPFPSPVSGKDGYKDYSEEGDTTYTYEKTKQLFQWAVENTKTSGIESEPDDIFKKALQEEWIRIKKEISDNIANYDNAVREGKSVTFDGFKIDDLRKLEAGNVDQVFDFFEKVSAEKKINTKFALRAHLSYAKVELTDRPSLAVNSPQFSAKNIRVKATATGELWAQIPRFICCRWFGPICICVRVEWHWVKLAQLTVAPRIGCDATVVFDVENLKINATGRFDKLFLDYNILRDINLAAIGNIYLRRKKFELYDVSQFVASIPYINKNFAIEDIRIPAQTGNVKVDVDVKKIK